MSKGFRTKKEVLREVELLVTSNEMYMPTELEKCIQFVLNGSTNFRPMGEVRRCKGRESKSNSFYDCGACCCGFEFVNQANSEEKNKKKKYQKGCK